MTSRAELVRRDAADPLARYREEFLLPPGVIYLDGNSLGPLSRRAAARVAQVLHEEWGNGLIRSWNQAGWIDLPRRAGAKIARLIGAHEDEVVVADSTSINLFKVAAAALALRPGRKVILSEEGNFPTDLYLLAGLTGFQRSSGHELQTWPAAELMGALGPDVAVLCLTHVNYRSGALHDLAALSEAAHRAGALVVWDLAHSAGAVPLALTADGADFAVGCGYKYLNGGPGAPAFVYVARRHQEAAHSPLPGWLGHAAPFAFTPDYQPAPGVSRFQCGTPPVLALAALDAALDVWDGVDLAALRAKSMALGDLFLELVAATCPELQPACPRDAHQRGSQVSLRHPEGYALIQALIARGVIGDFRAPDVLRFGFAPLYLRYVDVFDAVTALTEVLRDGTWRDPQYQQRARVT